MFIRRADTLASSLTVLLATFLVVQTQFTFNDPPVCPGQFNCQPFSSCPSVVDKNNICDFQGSEPLVCCPVQSTRKPIISSTTSATSTISGIPSSTPSSILNSQDCGKTKAFINKIVGGEVAQPGTWPWMCALYVDGEMACGASLIADQWALTAGHCVYDDSLAKMPTLASRMKIRMGVYNLSSSNHQPMRISKVVPHPDFKGAITYGNDLALLYLAEKVKFSLTLQPCCLPGNPKDRGDPTTKNLTGDMAFIAGWGRTSSGGKVSPVLLQAQIQIWSDVDCQQFYNKMIPITTNTFCAGLEEGGKDSCQGDSGGPLVFPGVQTSSDSFYCVGLVSFGKSCAQPGVPGAYTKVGNYWNWIDQQIRTK